MLCVLLCFSDRTRSWEVWNRPQHLWFHTAAKGLWHCIEVVFSQAPQSSWYGTCRIHYPCCLPTEAESAHNYSGFMVISPEESNLKQVQHHQEMRPVTWGFKRIWASRHKYNLAENTQHSLGHSSLCGTVFPLAILGFPTFDKKFPDLWWN